MSDENFDNGDCSLGHREGSRQPHQLNSSTPHLEYAREQKIVRKYDELVFWLSATGEGSWDSFVNVCRVLQLISDVKQASHIFRRLVLLGYAERSEDGSRWCVCPPTIVQNATDSDSVYLCGQRVPSLLAELSTFAIVESPQPEMGGPSRIGVRCDTTTLCEDIRQKKNFHFLDAGVASMKLAEVLPHLNGWVSSLSHIDRLNTANYEIKKWDGKKYVTCTSLYERNGYYYGDSGLYRLTNDRDASKYSLDLYFDAYQQRWLKGDWYGLRFMANRAAWVESKALINMHACTLTIKSRSRWPLIYERALILASGLLPSARTKPGWLIYQGISVELARILTDKLELPLHILGRLVTLPTDVGTKTTTTKSSSKSINLPSQVVQRARWLARTAEVLKGRHGAAVKPLRYAIRTSLKQLEFLPNMQKLCSMTSAPAPLIPHFEALARLIRRLDFQQPSSKIAVDR
ncbi:MAG: hypothetical protein LC803_18455 [Acidobacteria bacterium]|nr:hypothetical protein [Acidobacteriota bacterium]